LRIGDGLLQAIDFATDCRSGQVCDLAVKFVAALSDREARIGAEGGFDELVDEASPVARRRSLRRGAVVRRFRYPATGKGQCHDHRRGHQIRTLHASLLLKSRRSLASPARLSSCKAAARRGCYAVDPRTAADPRFPALLDRAF